MNSLPTITGYNDIQSHNNQQYFNVLKQCDPELYVIKYALQETGVNPLIIPQFIRALHMLATGARYGKVTTFMSNGVITAIKSEESNLMNYITIEVDKKELTI